mgnify:CR=1 FL=1
MKFVGYLKEHESGLIKMGVSINDMKLSRSCLFEEYRPGVLNYLEKAPILLASLIWLKDTNGGSIGPLIIHTDGYWIWPSYLVYYLNQGYQSLISEEFIEDIRKANFKVGPLTDEERRNVEIFYSDSYHLKRK